MVKFWTEPWPYWNMKERANQLWSWLRDSDLVIFKVRTFFMDPVFRSDVATRVISSTYVLIIVRSRRIEWRPVYSKLSQVRLTALIVRGYYSVK